MIRLISLKCTALLVLIGIAACSANEPQDDQADGAQEATQGGEDEADDAGENQPASEVETSSKPEAEQIPSLQAKLDARSNKPGRDPNSPRAVAFREGIDAVGESEAMQNALRSGDQAPTFTLNNAQGEAVSMADLLDQGPVVIVWYRGVWCPYCNIQLQAMRDILPKLEAENATLIAISPEAPDYTLAKLEEEPLGFDVLTDTDNQVAREFQIVYTMPEMVNEIFVDNGLDLAERNASGNYDMPLAITYVIDRDATIAWHFVDKDYKKRAEPAEVLKHVRALND